MSDTMEFQKTPGWLDWYAGPSKPRFKLPAGAVDAHCHVFGPGVEFPYAPERKYTPCDASRQQLYALRDHLGYELGAGTVRGIMKFLAAGVGAKMSLIFQAEKRALVVIEPPREALVAGVFEIDDGVLCPVKFNVEKKLTRPVR